MKEEKENTISKIDQFMSDIDVEKDFLNTDTGQKYEIGKSGPIRGWNHFGYGFIFSSGGRIPISAISPQQRLRESYARCI